jgi:hypothetical protein
MKYVLSSLLLLFVLVSCQKELTEEIFNQTGDTTIVIPPVVSGIFKAKIKGVQWTADKATSAAITTPGNGLPGLINITGLGLDGKVITITLSDSGQHVYTLNDQTFGAGAYNNGDTNNIASYTTNQGPAGVKAGTVSVIKIDTVAKTISGTFSFKVFRQIDSTNIDITEGTFTNIPYVTDGNVLPPASATDTFRVKIDDTLFVPYSISGDKVTMTNSIMIQGSDSLVKKNVGLTVPQNITPGTYPFDFATVVGLYNTGVSPTFPTGGELKILEHNTTTKRIRGNFRFTVIDNLLMPTDSSKLTEGYFSVRYK